ncbi:hypothetical protein D3C72_510570 [compost metagenome]
MKSIIKIAAFILFLLPVSASAQQFKHSKQVTVPVSGNCDMCAATIQKAGSAKQLSSVSWNKDTKIATITFDSSRTSADAVLKKIALAGYDNPSFRAPDDAYTALPGCCQYERAVAAQPAPQHNMQDHKAHEQTQNQSLLQPVLNHYLAVKDALVQSDGAAAQQQAAALQQSLEGISMSSLGEKEHMAWMKVYEQLIAESKVMAVGKDVAKQRRVFMELSQHMYTLVQAMQLTEPLYWQFCPMYNNGKGANWISKEKEIQNPYYGSQMLTCGRVAATIE